MENDDHCGRCATKAIYRCLSVDRRIPVPQVHFASSMSSAVNFAEHSSMNRTDTLIFPIAKLEIPCANRLEVVLFTHCFYTTVVHIFLLYPIILILLFKLFSRPLPSVASQSAETDDYSLLMRELQEPEVPFWQWPVIFSILKEEVKLVTAYLGAAVLFTSLRHSLTSGSITWLLVMRWAIESFCGVYILPCAFLLSYSVPWLAPEDDFDFDLDFDFRLPLIYPRGCCGRMVIAVKVPLFIVMRYAETCSSSSLNDMQIRVSKLYCQ